MDSRLEACMETFAQLKGIARLYYLQNKQCLDYSPVSVLLSFLSKPVHAFLDIILQMPCTVHQLVLAILKPASCSQLEHAKQGSQACRKGSTRAHVVNARHFQQASKQAKHAKRCNHSTQMVNAKSLVGSALHWLESCEGRPDRANGVFQHCVDDDMGAVEHRCIRCPICRTEAKLQLVANLPP